MKMHLRKFLFGFLFLVIITLIPFLSANLQIADLTPFPDVENIQHPLIHLDSLRGRIFYPSIAEQGSIINTQTWAWFGTPQEGTPISGATVNVYLIRQGTGEELESKTGYTDYRGIVDIPFTLNYPAGYYKFKAWIYVDSSNQISVYGGDLYISKSNPKCGYFDKHTMSWVYCRPL